MNNTFKILVSSDIHLGYAENDPIRGNDSFNTFEEILEIANKKAVDFILLAGDLFHESKPSTNCLHRCVNLLRKYCMGNKPISFRVVSDQNKNFGNFRVNYEDPNINISFPVFSIHGNHDDPTGQYQLSSLDILSASGLVNYFGKSNDLTKLDIAPVLLTKGSTKLSIYGLSHIKDVRLARLFRDRKFEMIRPSEDTNNWFNVFVCHQNRVDRGENNYLPEQYLPDFLDLIIWGHEHECRIQPERNSVQNFDVIQPGSPVATSLCEGEAVLKHVTILEIQDKKFRPNRIKLETVRPFVLETVCLSDCDISLTNGDISSNVQNYLQEKMESCIVNSVDQRTGHPRQPVEPLIRLRVEYSDEKQCFNAIRFGQKYQNRVANPTDVVLLRKQKGFTKRRSLPEDFSDVEIEQGPDIWDIRVESIIEKYFEEQSSNKLQILSAKTISEAAADFIEKNDKDSIRKLISDRMKEMEIELENSDISTDKIPEVFDNPKVNVSNLNISVSDDEECFGVNSTRRKQKDVSENTESRRAARGGARGSRGNRGRGRGKKYSVMYDDED